MAGQIHEVIHRRAVIDDKELKELDSLFRKHCRSIDDQAVLKYLVCRKDCFSYDTEDVEDIIRERNGAETHIDSIRLSVYGSATLKFTLLLTNCIEISGECKDKARLVEMASDIKMLLRERMIKGKDWKKKKLLGIVAAIAFMATIICFHAIQNAYENHVDAQYWVKYNDLIRPYKKQIADDSPWSPALLSQAEGAVSKHDLSSEVNFLVQEDILNMHQHALGAIESRVTIPYTSPSWWTHSYWLLAAAALVAALLAVGVAYLVIPDNGVVFLIGDEAARQVGVAKRRDRIIWGVGVTFLIGVVAGVVSSAVHF